MFCKQRRDADDRGLAIADERHAQLRMKVLRHDSLREHQEGPSRALVLVSEDAVDSAQLLAVTSTYAT